MQRPHEHVDISKAQFNAFVLHDLHTQADPQPWRDSDVSLAVQVPRCPAHVDHTYVVYTVVLAMWHRCHAALRAPAVVLEDRCSGTQPETNSAHELGAPVRREQIGRVASVYGGHR